MKRLKIISHILLIIGACLSLAPPADAAEVTVHRDMAYKSGQNLGEYERERCVLDLYVPTGVDSFPTIVWFHGGNIMTGDKAGEDHAAISASLAARGIAVASVNYRLSPRAQFPSYIDDAAASVAWILGNIDDYGGSEQNVFVSGHSAGGYLAAMVGLNENYLAAYGYGLNDIAGMLPISGQMITHETVREERGQPRWRPVIDGAAPVFNITADAPPWLAITGSEDLPARSAENRYLVDALRSVNHSNAMFIEFAGRNHGTIMSHIPEDEDSVALAMIAFVNRFSR